jgi:protein-disulfide isomerase
MAKLSRRVLSSLSKEDLVDYTDSLQHEKGWHPIHFLAVLLAFLVGFLFKGSLSGDLEQKRVASPSPGESSPSPTQAPKKISGLSLDAQKFNDCLDSGKYEQAVKDDFEVGSKAGVAGTPSFFINGMLVRGAQPFEQFKAVIEDALEGFPDTDKSELVDVDPGSLPIKGQEDALVTIVEFSDYQCPFSAKFAQEALPQIEEEYIDTGKVKLAFRDFPLPMHSLAQKASEAARCAGEQNAFWEYHDLIFENQQYLSLDQLKAWAGE